ncbi:SRPBCC family protein [Aspergillus novofumigatus IBT 16806]|uniref:DUF3074 domain-containing protein n=1 Tax=Aspergillus novofumigatus (strain IBT 16806) TaxID=1392255 RepID=A0A2I1BZS2_ASPN1|nr:uncharacterized protein P174DRAFT_514845 [Aspergillus novofumigatus IBT 16806]PKX90855.1 hypothetical protein P174DRAFT_514845 [Aspergillus novofumigatus IBT 16806]
MESSNLKSTVSTPLIRLSPHPFSSLPAHPSLNASPSSPRPPLHSFLETALSEAHSLLTDTIPYTFKVDPKLRSSPPATAKVQLLKRTIRNGAGSVHRDAAVAGSASWEEFRRGLRENHSENEMAYTPSVTSVERLLEWPTEGRSRGLDSPRTFISLVISADLLNFDRQAFMTVQIPLASKPTDAIPHEIREKVASAAPRNAVFASYASVEQVVSVPTPAVTSNPDARGRTGDANQLEWTMATTSDAGGAIPRWIQRSWTMGGVAKAIVADVGYFISWTDQQRSNISDSA